VLRKFRDIKANTKILFINSFDWVMKGDRSSWDLFLHAWVGYTYDYYESMCVCVCLMISSL
jgi:hypothetical protein